MIPQSLIGASLNARIEWEKQRVMRAQEYQAAQNNAARYDYRTYSAQNAMVQHLPTVAQVQSMWPWVPSKPKREPLRSRWKRHPAWCRAVLWDCFQAAPIGRKLRALWVV